MIWGIAFSFNPKNWRLGHADALNDQGRKIGDWWFLGPIAITRDWE